MNKISARQLLFYLAAIAPVGKLVLMPTQLAYYSKNDLLFPAAMNFVLQAGVIFLVLLLAKQNLSFFTLLKNTLGKVGAKIVLCVLALFMFFAALLPLFEQKLFVQSVFYDTLPSILTFSTFFLFSAYLCAKPLSSFGRMWDILTPLSIVGFFGIVVFTLCSADFHALAPVGITGAKGIFSGFLYTMSWFFDSVILLSLLGKFEYKRGLAWKGTVCYLAGAAAVLFFLALFYGVFQDIAVRQQFAFTKISKYFPGIQVLGRIDYLFIFSLALVMAFYASLPLQAGIDFLKQAFVSQQNRVLPICASVAINIAMLAVTLLFDYRYITISETVTRTLFWIFPVFTTLLPALALLLKIRSRNERTE